MLIIALAVGIGLGTAGCSETADTTPSTSVLPGVPMIIGVEGSSQDSAFCRAMLNLTTEDESPAPLAGVISGYRQVLDDVPVEIAAEFAVVLDRLIALDQGGEVLGVEQAEEASLALSEYVDAQCRSTVVSPLPPPTQPLSD
jgi:hypothetical protein